MEKGVTRKTFCWSFKKTFLMLVNMVNPFVNVHAFIPHVHELGSPGTWCFEDDVLKLAYDSSWPTNGKADLVLVNRTECSRSIEKFQKSGHMVLKRSWTAFLWGICTWWFDLPTCPDRAFDIIITSFQEVETVMAYHGTTLIVWRNVKYFLTMWTNINEKILIVLFSG